MMVMIDNGGGEGAVDADGGHFRNGDNMVLALKKTTVSIGS